MKKLPANVRWMLLMGLLAATAAAAFFEPADDSALTQPVAPIRKHARDKHREEPTNQAVADLQLDKLKRTAASKPQEATSLFQPKSWYVPPPPPKPAPPPPPSPPPLPFVYMGKMLEDGKPLVFLSRQDRNFVVKEGDIVAGNYRVEKIKPPLMTLIYLPLNMQQTLTIGAAN